MATTTYKVTGMTCEHCVNAVTSELTGLNGGSPLPGTAVTEALDEAGGYLLAR